MTRQKGRAKSERAGLTVSRARQAERLTREELVARARHLPPRARALVVAHYDAGVSLDDLAALHEVSRQGMYRQLVRWRELLSDPAFLLAAHFRRHVPAAVARLASEHWMQGQSLRQLARGRGTTMHEIRTRLAEARVSLTAAAARMRDAGEWVGNAEAVGEL